MFARYNLKKRHEIYKRVLNTKSPISAEQLIKIGEKLMRSSKIHHHYHGSHSIKDNAASLVKHALFGKCYDPSDLDNIYIEEIFNLYEERIGRRVPVEYITNEAQYHGNKFYVNEDVLVPRSLIEHRFSQFLNDQEWSNYRVLDLCCGSGCIGITLALIDPRVVVTLSDISDKAIIVAKKNIERFGLGYRVEALQSDLFENIKGKFDLIISNPPYVPTKDYLSAPAEFLNEPRIALDSGKKGINFTNQLLSQAKKYLNSNGSLIVEVGVPAAKNLKSEHPNLKFEWFKYKKENGKESLFALPCAFKLNANELY